MKRIALALMLVATQAIPRLAAGEGVKKVAKRIGVGNGTVSRTFPPDSAIWWLRC
jgi:hypothetical protein